MKRHLSTLLAGCGLSLIVSCQGPPTVRVAADLASLLPLFQKALPGVSVSLEDPKAPETNTLRITTTPGLGLPEGSAKSTPIPLSWSKGLRWYLPPAFSLLGSPTSKTVTVVPLAFDAWGSTQFLATKQDSLVAPLSWGQAFTDPVSIAGGRPSFRQAWFFLGSSKKGNPSIDGETWFTQPASPWLEKLQNLPSTLGQNGWAADAWSYTRADQQNLYRPGSPTKVIETYRDYELNTTTGFRKFAALIGSASSGGTALAGPVVFVEYRGTNPNDAAPLLKKLAAVDLNSQHWLSSNLNALEVDPLGSQLRYLVAQAQRFVPVSDALPATLSEESLMGQIQFIVGHWRR